MCGVAAYVGPALTPDRSVALVEAMTSDQTHRGPDDRSVVDFSGGRVVLGYCRLAIIGTGRGGNQPLISRSGDTVVVYNGEIYNHRQLVKRYSLETASPSDGSVIPELYERFGRDAFGLLRGMFAIVLLDRRTGRVTLARDSFGIKPLHTRRVGGGLAIASEVRPLVSLEPPPTVDVAAVQTFLRFGSVPVDCTLFQDIRVVPPNRWQTLDLAGEVVEEGEVATLPPEHSSKSLPEALAESVEMHLESDVPAALLLSAGVDSTAIACAAQRLGRKLACVTLELAGGADEVSVAEKTAAHYGHEHHRIRSDITADDVESFFGAVQSPSIDGLNTWLVARAVAESGHKVALSGLGADELLGGYPHFRRLRLLPLLSALDRSGPLQRLAASRFHGKARQLLSRGGPRDAWGLTELHRSIRDPDSAAVALRGSAVSTVRNSGLRSSLTDMVTAEVNLYLQPTLLRDADGHSMTHSVELRVPFVDMQFYAASLKQIAAGRAGKQLFVRAMGDSRLAEVAQRTKTGFSLPMGSWLREGALRPFVQASTALDAPVWQYLTEQAREEVLTTSRSHWPQLWSVVALDHYLRSMQAIHGPR